MKIGENVRAFGEYRFDAFDAHSGLYIPEKSRVYHNVVTQLFFNAIFNFLMQDTASPSVSDLNANYFALGTGTTAAAKSDTALVSEQFRKSTSSRTKNNTQFIAKLSLAASEAVMTITEIGVFANASETSGSGTLISRAIVNIPKTAAIKYLITYTMTIQ